MRLSIKLISSTIIISALTYILSPIYCLLSFNNALKKNDFQTFDSYIDFHSLRKDLKSQFSLYLNNKTSNIISEQENYKLKMLLINPIIDNVIDKSLDATITPKGLNRLLNTGFMTKNLTRESSRNNNIPYKDPEVKHSIYYKNINLFVLQVDSNKDQKTIIAKWKRYNFVQWKLYSIKLPL